MAGPVFEPTLAFPFCIGRHMRALLFTLPFIALSACGTPAQQQTASASVDTVIDIPMDPGTLRCTLLGNSNAQTAATDWVMGRARAAALSGRIANVPDQAGVASNLATYCRANPNATVRDASAQIGF